MIIEYTECAICEGRGGEVEHDMQGDGVWMTPVTYFVPCDCLENALCPGCSRAIPDGDAQQALDAVDTFTCGACGWHIDWERIDGPYEPDY